jgi:hypothetical protein
MSVCTQIPPLRHGSNKFTTTSTTKVIRSTTYKVYNIHQWRFFFWLGTNPLLLASIYAICLGFLIHNYSTLLAPSCTDEEWRIKEWTTPTIDAR